MEVIRTHPVNIVGGLLQENPFFTPADRLRREQRPGEAELERSSKISRAPKHPGQVESIPPEQLRSCIRDLVGILVLPATWRGSNWKSIVDHLLDTLITLVQLEFAFASVGTCPAGKREYFCKSSNPDLSIAPQELARFLERQLRDRRPTVIASPFGNGTLRTVSLSLGLNAKWGTVVAASAIEQFPTLTEMLLLTVASNQAVLALEDMHTNALEADKLRLESEKLRAAVDLAQLRGQLEPHFLLNTLNAIAGLVTAEPREARRLLVSLGDLLRDSLRGDGEMQTLDEQIQWLRRYAEILEARHDGRLVFRWQIPDEARPILVPRFLLQPLVENAVRHGALRRERGEVVVRAQLVGADGGAATKLVCIVEDNGPGLPEGEARAGGYGLVAVRQLLALKYGDRASLRFESTSTGTRAIVELPAQRMDSPRAAP